MKLIPLPTAGVLDQRSVLTGWRWLFILFLAGGYALSPNPVWAFIFYAALAPLTLWAWATRRIGLPPMNRVAICGILVIAWFWISVAWGSDEPLRQIEKYLGAGPSNLVFFVAGLSFFATADEVWRRHLACALTLAGGANALYSILWYLFVDGNGGRLAGYAETRQSILGAAVVSIAALYGLHLLGESTRWRERILWGCCVVLAFTFVALTGSRGPVIALCLATLAMTALLSQRTALVLLTAAVALAISAWQIDAVRDMVLENVARPSYRLAIWRDTLALVAHKPFFGYGVGSQQLSSAGNATFPHSVYLSALFYGGVIGLALLLALLAAAFWRAVKLPERRERALCVGLLLIPIVNGITDVGQAIKPPGSVWYILWLPLMIVAGAGRQSDTSSAKKIGMP